MFHTLACSDGPEVARAQRLQAVTSMTDRRAEQWNGRVYNVGRAKERRQTRRERDGTNAKQKSKHPILREKSLGPQAQQGKGEGDTPAGGVF